MKRELRTCWEPKVAGTYQPWWCSSMGIRTRWKLKVAGTYQLRLCCQWNINTHMLIVENGRNMSAAMVQCSSWNEITHPLRVRRGRNMSAMIVRLMGCKYTPPDKRKWQEHVSHYGAAHEMGIRTRWELTVAGTCQPPLRGSGNINTHLLIIEHCRSAVMVQLAKCYYAPTESQNGRNVSAMTMLFMKYGYALPDNRKGREHVSHNGAAREIRLRTHWESKVAGTSQLWLCCSWNISTHFLIIENNRNI